jgi:cytochrome d ubiquinol oxidase subunit I
MNTAGWMLTENGRQPWIVQGILLTRNGVSPSISAATVATSLIVFLILYGVLAVIDAILMSKYARKEIDEQSSEDAEPGVAALTY